MASLGGFWIVIYLLFYSFLCHPILYRLVSWEEAIIYSAFPLKTSIKPWITKRSVHDYWRHLPSHCVRCSSLILWRKPQLNADAGTYSGGSQICWRWSPDSHNALQVLYCPEVPRDSAKKKKNRTDGRSEGQYATAGWRVCSDSVCFGHKSWRLKCLLFKGLQRITRFIYNIHSEESYESCAWPSQFSLSPICYPGN